MSWIHAHKRTLSIALIVALLAIGLWPILQLAFYNHPLSDDFSYAYHYVKPAVDAGASPLDLLVAAAQTSAYFYQTWQGLYASAFMLALPPNIFGESYYAITTYILLTVSCAAFACFTKTLVKQVFRANTKAWIGVAVLTWFFFVQTIPNIFEGLYWYDGAMDYLFFWCFFLFTITFALAYLTSAHNKRICWLVCTCIFAFVTAGGNHVSTIACILCLFGLALFECVTRRQGWLFIPLAIIALGLLVVLVAPGTAIRADALGMQSSGIRATLAHLFDAGKYAAWWSMERIGNWMTLSVACLVLALFPFATRIAQKAQLTWQCTTQTWAALVAGFLFLLWAQLFILQYSTFGPGAGRATNILYASFCVFAMICTLLAVYASVHRGAKKGLFAYNFALYPGRSAVIVAAALSMLLFSSGSPLGFTPSTWEYAAEDLSSGRAAAFSAEQNARAATLDDPGAQDVYVEPLSALPYCLTSEVRSSEDLSTDAAYWANDAVARYYNKHSVQLTRELEAKRPVAKNECDTCQ